MRGDIRVKDEKFDDFRATIENVFQLLNDPKGIVSTAATKNGRDFFDAITAIYRDQALSEQFPLDDNDDDYDRSIMLRAYKIKFIKRICNLFNPTTATNPDNIKVLQGLGATENDIDLLSNNKDGIISAFHSTNESNHLELAKKFRMLEIAKKYYKDDFIPSKEQLQIHYKQGQDVHKADWVDINKLYSYQTSKSPEQINNIVISVYGNGHKTWDYNTCRVDYESKNKLFDSSISVGNSARDLTDYDLDTLINISNNKLFGFQSSTKSLCLVHIKMHDSKNSGLLDDALSHVVFDSKDTVFFIDTCFSGQYHQSWQDKKAVIITTSSDTENTITHNFFDQPEAQKYFGDNNKMTKETLIEYLVTKSNYKGSTPHMSGAYGEVGFQNIQLADFYKVMQTDKAKYNFQKVVDHIKYTLDIGRIEQKYFQDLRKESRNNLFNEPIQCRPLFDESNESDIIGADFYGNADFPA